MIHLFCYDGRIKLIIVYRPATPPASTHPPPPGSLLRRLKKVWLPTYYVFPKDVAGKPVKRQQLKELYPEDVCLGL